MIKKLIARIQWFFGNDKVSDLSDGYVAYMSTSPTFEEFKRDFIGEVKKLTITVIPEDVVRDYFYDEEMTPKQCAKEYFDYLNS